MNAKHRSDAQLVRDVKDLQPTRGVSSNQLRGCLRFIQRFPERGQEVLDALAPHMPQLGQQAFANLCDTIGRVRPDLLTSLVALVPANAQGVLLLNKLAVGQQQPDSYLLCRARLAEAADEDMRAFDARCGRQGIIHVFYGPIQDKSFALLDAVLAQPGTLDLIMDVRGEKLDWASTVVAQTLAQSPRNAQFEAVIDRLVQAGVQLQAPGEPCKALEIAAEGFTGHVARMKEYVDTLLQRGARWQGLELNLDELRYREFLAYIHRHPVVRADKLMSVADQAREQTADDTPRSKRPAL